MPRAPVVTKELHLVHMRNGGAGSVICAWRAEDLLTLSG
jgi:hypothetical protein